MAKVLQWIFEILETQSPYAQATTILHKTVLTFFGTFEIAFSYTLVPYAKSLELHGLTFKALEICFQGVQIPEISSAAARGIDKIIRSSSSVGLHAMEVTQATRNLVSAPGKIEDKICVVEGYTFFVTQNMDKDEISQYVSYLIEAFDNIDFTSCDSEMALQVLKIVYSIGKTLYTTSPGKLASEAWTTGRGRDMAEWVRRIIITLSRRFPDDFEIMEVTSRFTMLRAGYYKHRPILDFEWTRIIGVFARERSRFYCLSSHPRQCHGIEFINTPLISGYIIDKSVFKCNSA